MARYQNTLQTPAPAETYASAISQYMTDEGFALVDYKGAQVWKKGIGMATAPQYLAIQYDGNTINIEAFIRWALLPGVYVGEMGTTGFVGAIPKKLLRNRVETLESYIANLPQTPVE